MFEYKYINNIKNPNELIDKNIDELKVIADEVRNRILEVTSKNGGHLASSLGTVELTTALYSEFDINKDIVVWDVGHQAYPHKILTGRFKEFETLRKTGGISGFLKREESKYDYFEAGHSSTSISAAIGFATARDLSKENYKIISVIGDGSLTSGLAFEALNYAGHLKKDMIIILNDNEMSISENVGALSEYLSKARVEPHYVKIKQEIEQLLKKIPRIGERIGHIIDKGRNALKYLMIPGVLFEELGFKYFGPIDGHNIENLKDTFRNIKNIKKPVLLHVVTKKGRGYSFAEKKPDKFHGVSKFDLETGDFLKKKSSIKTYTEIFSDTMIKLAENDEKIVAITAAMPDGTGLAAFKDKFNERFFDVGITEPNGVVFAASLAIKGYKPVVTIYSTFLQRAYDNILHDVALQKLPVIFALDRAGIVGEDGPTHHGNFDLSYLRHIPNMVIMAPKDENELQHMLFTATQYSKGPIAIRYPRRVGVGVKLDQVFYELEIGKSELIFEGKDILFIAIGTMVNVAIEVAKKLKYDKINSTVINARFIKPLDNITILGQARKIKNIIILEENSIIGGFSSAVTEIFCDKEITDLNIKRIGIPDRFIDGGHIDDLLKQCNLDVDSIYNISKEFFEKASAKNNSQKI